MRAACRPGVTTTVNRPTAFAVSQVRAVAAGVVLYTAGHVAFKRLFEPEAVEENEPEPPVGKEGRTVKGRAAESRAAAASL